MIFAIIATACSKRPNVVLVTLDTTRADHVSALGYERMTTPHLERIASEGVSFTRAYSAASWTLPSHASIFTSLLPSEHGCGLGPNADSPIVPLRADVLTLAEVLEAEGYRTAGFIGGPYLDSEFGVARGFEIYDDDFSGSKRDGREVNEKIFDWLDSRPEEPLFLFVNYFDAHGPFCPDPTIEYPFGPQPNPDGSSYDSFSPGNAQRTGQHLPSTPDEIAAILTRYDQEIFAADHWLGELVAHLEGMECWDSSFVVVTADHGESFGERIGKTALWGHGYWPFASQCHVPLVFRPPGGMKEHRFEGPVSNADVFLTLLLHLGIPPPHGIQGRNLMDSQLLDGPMEATTAIAEETSARGRGIAVWSQKYQYLQIAEGEPARTRELLFDLRASASDGRHARARAIEKKSAMSESLKATGQAVLDRLRARRESMMRARTGFIPPMTSPQSAGLTGLPPDVRKRLEALGYLR
ncbi:MAG: sulfatase [Planctomycetes bacterium]|nr:sulfatase [Planctomycetota bacterium]MBI3843663.1 sulfatase [Planctomycetota bacterium]